MDLETVTLNEVSWTEKDKYHMISLICGILKKGTKNLFTGEGNSNPHQCSRLQNPKG